MLHSALNFGWYLSKFQCYSAIDYVVCYNGN